MADKSEKAGAPLFTVEQLQQKLNIFPAACAGAMAQQGWSKGKQVTEKEFSAAITNFMMSPTRGGKG